MGGSHQQRLTIWDLAKQPHLQRYCDLLGRAHTQIERSPAAAREAAVLANQVLPGKAAPWVVIGRANVSLGDFQQALEDFQKARTIEARSIEDPSSLHALAIAQSKAGKLQDAMETYRVLVPRLQLLPDTDDRVAVLLAAASVNLRRGPSGLAEASALLSEARAQPLSQHDPSVLGMLALVLDRSSRRAEADAVLELLARANLIAQLASKDPASLRFLHDPNEWNAVVALALEREDRVRAIASWERYAQAKPAPPFLDHANAHLDALRKGPKPNPR